MAEKAVPATGRGRGRPRAYDPCIALQRARDAFWKAGYAGTSLEDLVAATSMNRPSLRAAFGDKREIYLRTLKAYWDFKSAAMREAVEGQDLENALMRVYEMSLDTYFSGEGSARGCFVVGTAVTEAAEDPDIRRIVSEGFRMLDESFASQLRAARANGELACGGDPDALALLASATLHSMAVRARAGASREELRALARKAVGVICGTR